MRGEKSERGERREKSERVRGGVTLAQHNTSAAETTSLLPPSLYISEKKKGKVMSTTPLLSTHDIPLLFMFDNIGEEMKE